MSRQVQPYRRTLYRGGSSMWSWIFHRGSGLAVLGFLFLHILDTSLVGLGPEHYDKFVKIYKGPVFRPLEVILMGFVIFHSFNGLRIILVDFWSKGARHQAALSRAVAVISILLFLPAAFFMLQPLFVR
ncbi:MAG TPA: succinate dehydrogenase, cytochrome b556 subunit [Actinomycetota bacterium]|nr:succinate dehydrogenase, cytochrome b556 subunit [Actinomycetota bacterium]